VQRYVLPGNKYYVRGSDVVALRGLNTTINVYMTASQWQETTTPFNILPGMPTQGINTPQVDVGKFVAVRVDASGNIVGIVGTNSAGTSAVAQTCWASITANLV
jgi:hypothetical protein